MGPGAFFFGRGLCVESYKDVSKLKSKIYRVIFHRDLFAICECVTDEDIPNDAIKKVDIHNGKRHFIALGDGLCKEPGRDVVLSGHWEYNEKYSSYQLKIYDCFDHVGTGRDEIVAYLSSKILKGIGKKTANAIYDRFGENSLEVIESNPKALMEVSGIKEKKLAKILSSYEKNRELHALTRLLAPFNISYKTVVRIHRRLGDGSAALVRANPYRLCDMAGFGFKKTDEIALKMGDFSKSDERIQGAIVYVLRNAQMEYGHLYLPRGELLERCCSSNVLNNGVAEQLTAQNVSLVLDGMIRDESVRVLEFCVDASGEQPICCIYTNDVYSYEITVAETIAKKLDVSIPFQDWDEIVKDTTDELGVQLDEIQFQGAIVALNSPVSVITGGPGTGKTTGLRAIVTSYMNTYPDKTIQLAAPTGRAARRMSEQTGLEARTLHSLLGLKPDTHTNFYAIADDEDMVDADFLVVDEASMIDAQLMAELMFRLPLQTQVLFLGDVDQLPSVGPGNVLRQLLACESIPHVKLEKIFRQKNGSVIPYNAANIRNGVRQLYERNSFKIIRCKNEDDGAKVIQDMYRRCMEKGLVRDTQVLCPMKKRGATGTWNLNSLLQGILNPQALGKREVHIGNNLFRVGDKVMQTRNIEGVSNGDIGYIQDISGTDQDGEIIILVKFDTCVVEYDYEDAFDLELAYAITIHKSQGSEFPAVIVPIFKSMAFFTRRNILYTAVTRAKDQVVIITDLDAAGVWMAIEREDSSRRNTGLAALIERG